MKQKRDAIGQFASMPRKPKKPTPPTIARVVAQPVKPKTPNTILVKARGGVREISTTHIDNDTRWVYENGQCFSLAIVLAEKHGTDVGLLVALEDFPWGTKYEDIDIHKLDLKQPRRWLKWVNHAITLTKDAVDDKSLVLDINGEQEMVAVRKEFLRMREYSIGTMLRIKPGDLRILLSKHLRGPRYLSQTMRVPK